MGRRRKKKSRNRIFTGSLAAAGLLIVFAAGALLAQKLEARLNAPVPNAGERLTVYTAGDETAQVFMNGRWYAPKNVQTVLVIGIDDYGREVVTHSYNNMNQADFLALFIHDQDTGENAALHLNRDTMTDIPVLGVTGAEAGSRYAQLALAYNYGSGGSDSGQNTMKAVSHLLYGMKIDHHITLKMNAIPVLNDWAGGVTVEVLDDFSGIDDTLVAGQKSVLYGEHALRYVQMRRGLDDSSNIQRMKRQRQYAAAWLDAAQEKLKDQGEVASLVMQMSDYHYSDCTAEELAQLAEMLSAETSISIRELKGEAVQGEQYMEYYVDEESAQQLVLDMFYRPVNE